VVNCVSPEYDECYVLDSLFAMLVAASGSIVGMRWHGHDEWPCQPTPMFDASWSAGSVDGHVRYRRFYNEYTVYQ
jgi:hypothetical protein